MSENATVRTPGKHGWTYQGVFIIMWVSLSVAMLIDALVNRKVDLVSNVTLLIASLIAGWKVRTNDYQAAIWAPALVWFVTLMTVGQLAPKRGGSMLREQILHIAYGLAAHAGWIIGATILSGAIAIIRRGRNL
ncbi:MAG: hypothetical protein RIR66_109 [Actinomycetota bacterium]|jgi:hypothetical protein